MAIRNPYATADWSGLQIAGLSHAHGTSKARFDEWTGGGARWLAISNYYPSDPNTSYPPRNITGVTSTDVAAAHVVGCPNAEHHTFANTGGHFGAIGSMLVSGAAKTPLLPDGAGYGGPWQDFARDVVANMLYADGGGLCINHPTLAYCGDLTAMQIVDYLRALGRVPPMELYSSMADWYYGGKGWATSSFHNILNTGRQIFAAAGLDHWGQEFGGVGATVNNAYGTPVVVPPLRGFNRLLVPSNFETLASADQEHECLKAVFDGRSYIALAATSPKLVSMTTDGSSVTVQFDASCDISFLSGRVGAHSAQASDPVTGTSATLLLDGKEIYVRAVGSMSTYEVSATQAIMFKDVADLPSMTGDATMRLRRRNTMNCCGIGGW